MAKREKRALGAFLQTFGSEYMRGRTEQKEEQRIARAKWLRCVMEGGENEDCLNISGYRPEEDELAGAKSERERRVGVERRAGLEEEGKEYTSLPIEKVGELGMPLAERMEKATIRPEGTTIPVKREEARFFKSLMPEEKKQLTGEALWLAENPGKTHEDYLRATKGIAKEFKEPKEPKVSYGVKETIKGKEEREKEIKAYAKNFRTAWYKRIQKIKEDEAFSITKEDFWREWKENLPRGFPADLLAKRVAKQVGIKEPKIGVSVTEKAGIGEKRFYGATSYEEVETAVADVPEPKKSEILKQAREFFGVK